MWLNILLFVLGLVVVGLIQTEAGQFELVISEEQAMSIDECEQALLRTNYPAIRGAIAKHLTELSKKSHRKSQFRQDHGNQNIPSRWRGGPVYIRDPSGRRRWGSGN
jgi:hypothetical protein